MSKSRIQVVLALAVVVWVVWLHIDGVSLKSSYLSPYSIAVTVAVVGLEVFDRWLWRLRPVAERLGPPVLRGTWRGELKSNWEDPQTGKRLPAILIFLAIQQTSSSVSIRMMSAESISDSLAATLSSSGDPRRLSWVYENRPQLSRQDVSRPHRGGASVEIHGVRDRTVAGEYWTDRGTAGAISLASRVDDIHTDFESARRAFSDEGPGVERTAGSKA